MTRAGKQALRDALCGALAVWLVAGGLIGLAAGWHWHMAPWPLALGLVCWWDGRLRRSPGEYDGRP